MVFSLLFGCEALLQEIFMVLDSGLKSRKLLHSRSVVEVLLAAKKKNKNVTKYRHERKL